MLHGDPLLLWREGDFRFRRCSVRSVLSVIDRSLNLANPVRVGYQGMGQSDPGDEFVAGHSGKGGRVDHV